MTKFEITGPATYKFVINAEDRAEAFEIFKDTKLALEHYGIGLSIEDIECKEVEE